MDKIDWKAKLSSRKFWAALIGFVSAVLMGLNFAETDITKIASIISAAGVLITYILVEGNIDAKRAEQEYYEFITVNKEDLEE